MFIHLMQSLGFRVFWITITIKKLKLSGKHPFCHFVSLVYSFPQGIQFCIHNIKNLGCMSRIQGLTNLLVINTKCWVRWLKYQLICCIISNWLISFAKSIQEQFYMEPWSWLRRATMFTTCVSFNFIRLEIEDGQIFNVIRKRSEFVLVQKVHTSC